MIAGNTPRQSHASWMRQKIAEGWVYGEVKDVEKRQHPCMLPYDELPPYQRAKDSLYIAIVSATWRALTGTGNETCW